MDALFRHRRRGLMLVAAILSAHTAWTYDVNPLGLVMHREHARSYTPGETFEVVIIIDGADGDGSIRALGVREHMPEGWTFVAARGYTDQAPDILPAVGAGPELNFAWIFAPPLPYAFSYTVAVPARDGGGKEIFGVLEYRLDDFPHYAAPVATDILGPDEIAPIILLRGSNPMELVQGESWREPGYIALDHNDMDVSSQVVVSGEVNTDVPGAYTIQYTLLSEEDGFDAQVTRVVHVLAAETTPGGSPTRPPARGAAAGRDGPRDNAALEIIAPPDATVTETPSAAPADPTQPEEPRPLEFPDLSPYRPTAELAQEAENGAPTSGEPVVARSAQDTGALTTEGEVARDSAAGGMTADTVAPKPRDDVVSASRRIDAEAGNSTRMGRENAADEGAARASARLRHGLAGLGVVAVIASLAIIRVFAYGARARRKR